MVIMRILVFLFHSILLFLICIGIWLWKKILKHISQIRFVCCQKIITDDFFMALCMDSNV